MTTPAPAAPPATAPGAPAAGKPPVDPKAPAGSNGAVPPVTPPDGLTAAEKRQWKLAVNGKETDLDITGIEFKDPKLEEKLKNLVQKGLGADERFQHSAKVEKMVEQFVHLLKTNPVKALSHPLIGHDMRKLAEEYLAKELERENMDPEKRAMLEEREKLEKDREEINREKQTENERKAAELKSHYSKTYSDDILNTLKTSGLPQSPRTVQRMAHYMHAGLVRGVELKASDVLPLVRQDYMDDIKALMGGLDEDALFALVGEDIAGKIRKADMKRLQRPGNPVPAGEQPAGTPTSKAPKYKSMNQFDELVAKNL